MPQHIENPHTKGHQPDQDHIREHDAGQGHRQGHLLGRCGKPGGHRMNDERSGHHADNGDNRQADQQQFQRTYGQTVGVFAIPVDQGIGENGDKGQAQGAFTEQPAQQIGNPESGDEGIGGHSGPEKRGQHHVAHVPENPAEQGGRPPPRRPHG